MFRKIPNASYLPQKIAIITMLENKTQYQIFEYGKKNNVDVYYLADKKFGIAFKAIKDKK